LQRIMTEPLTEVAVLKRHSVKSWSWFEDTVGDVTAEQANWWPPGTANSIGATYLHVVINADVEINRLIHRRAPLVEQWDGTVGQPLPYDSERFDRWVRRGPVDWEVLRRYGRAVQTAILGTVDRLTEAQLDMRVDMSRAGLGIWQGRDLVELHGIDHPMQHGAEIAVLKGLQGGVGHVESDAFRAAVEVVEYEQ
jgi:DinB superfamily